VTDADDLDPHFHSYFSAMPIRDLLEFAAPAGGPEPEARLEELLRSIDATTSGDRTRTPAMTGTRNG
jgi:hypothetical protein